MPGVAYLNLSTAPTASRAKLHCSAALRLRALLDEAEPLLSSTPSINGSLPVSSTCRRWDMMIVMEAAARPPMIAL